MSKGRYPKAKGVYLKRDFIESKTYRSLSCKARDILYVFYLKRRIAGKKHKAKTGTVLNNGKIQFSYGEAERLGISRATFTRALDKLIEVGFIDISHHGGGLEGDVSLYACTERWKEFGKPTFDKKERPKDTRGLGITSENWEERTGRKRKAIKRGITDDTCAVPELKPVEVNSSGKAVSALKLAKNDENIDSSRQYS